MTKSMTKADPYLHHRDEVAAIIGDEQYLFDSVEEALTLYRPAWEDEALGKRLAEDRELLTLIEAWMSIAFSLSAMITSSGP